MIAGQRLGPVLRCYLAGIIVFLLAPLAVVVMVAFTSASFVSFPPPGLSPRWLVRVLSDQTFLRPLGNSLVLGLAAAGCAALIATPAAIALVRCRLPGGAEIQSFLLSPLALPSLILSIGLLFFLSRIGLGNTFLGLLIGHVVITVPYLLRTIIAVYGAADRDIEAAAYVLGANPVRTFLWITLPMIRPAVIAGGLFAFLISFDEVAIALLLSTARTITLPVAILAYLINNYDPAVAAISVVKMALVVGVLFALERMVGLRTLILVRRRAGPGP